MASLQAPRADAEMDTEQGPGVTGGKMSIPEGAAWESKIIFKFLHMKMTDHTVVFGKVAAMPGDRRVAREAGVHF